jgi:hydroxyacylglutathione hydrolase
VNIFPFELGSFGVMAYVVTAGAEALIVDAPEGSEAIIDFCAERGLRPRVLVNTHGHGDHIACNELMKTEWPDLVIAIGRGDEMMLADAALNLSALFGFDVTSPPADRLLMQGDRVAIGAGADAVTFEVRATPGHTPGGISLYAATGPGGLPIVFTGDALFAGGVGRTDLPGSSERRLLAAIRGQLLTLPPETIVYPGHGPSSTIGQEAAENPFL